MRLAVRSCLAAFAAAVLLDQSPSWAQGRAIPPAGIGPVSAAPPTIDGIEPPNWWAGSRTNPVRLLIHGAYLAGARVTGDGAIETKNVKASTTGDYLFVDATIGVKAKPGPHRLTIATRGGSARVPFAISPALPPAGRFQGFSPDDVIYLIIPDRFCDGDPGNDDPAKSPGMYGRNNPRLYHGGDLQGIIDRLPYLKDLGVTAIWLTPIYDNADRQTNMGDPAHPSSDYHGYGAIDFYRVEEHFGDVTTFRKLVDRAHALGIKVIQDQVANHTGPSHPWTSDPPTPTWFNGTPRNHISNDWQVWTTIDPHANAAERAGTLDGWFANVLPDLNQEDPEVARYEIQNTLWWIGMTGIDGVREDTMPYVPRDFWPKWTGAIHRQYPRMTEVGEVFDGDAALVSYFQGGRKQADGIDTGMASLFDYPLYFPLRRVFTQGASFRDIAGDEAHDWLFADPNRLVTFLGLHDVTRFMSEKGATAANLELAQTFLLTNRGIPLIYYGDEIGMTGGDDPDNRRDFPGGFPGDARDAFTDAGRTPQEREIWSHVRRLTHLRASLAPLRRGTQRMLYLADKQWAYARQLGRETVLVALNNGDSPATFTVPLDGTGFTDGDTIPDRLEGASPLHVSGGASVVTLPAHFGAVFAK